MTRKNPYTEPEPQNLDNGIEDELIEQIMNDQLSLADFVSIWLELFKKNSIKLASYERLLHSLEIMKKYAISQKKICDISYFDIQRYINELVDFGYSLNNIKKMVQIVSAPLRQAAAMRVLSADPCVGIKMPTEAKLKKKTKEVIAYTKEEQEKIWKKLVQDPDNPGYAAVAFQIETGIRAGELLALKWTDVDIDRCRMKIHATIVFPQYTCQACYQDSAKSKSSNRIIPLTPKALTILRRLKEHRQTEWVFEKNNERYTYQKLTYQTRQLCQKAGVKYHGEHVFRHTFATNCYYKGIDIKILSRLMGHSSVQVTYNTYINLYGDGFDDMYAALCF